MPPDTPPYSASLLPQDQTSAPKRSRLAKFIARVSGKSADQLSPRQIKTARKIAEKRGVKRDSDADTLDMLKALVEGPAPNDLRVPSQPPNQSSTAQKPTDDSGLSVLKELEADVIHRRQSRQRALLWRLAMLVLLPSALLGSYFFFWATPHFATHTQMVIQRDDSAAGSNVGLLGAFQTPMTTEAAAVQGYLTSRDAMARLIADNGYLGAVRNPAIDWLQRLPDDAGNEKAFTKYQKQVRIGFDPTDNVIKMEVIAATPAHSLKFAQTLIALAEAKVDQMSLRLRSDRLRGANASYERAEERLADAQTKVLSLQHKRGVLSTELEASAHMNQISALQTSMQNNRLELAQLRDNLRPNPTREAVLLKLIERQKVLIAELRGALTSDPAGGASLARIDAELNAAQSELLLRQEMVSQTMNLMETARMEANRQSIYLATSVAPVLPDAPAYPRAILNTLLAFLGFSSLYLLVSLTGAILRDQMHG